MYPRTPLGWAVSYSLAGDAFRFSDTAAEVRIVPNLQMQQMLMQEFQRLGIIQNDQIHQQRCVQYEKIFQAETDLSY